MRFYIYKLTFENGATYIGEHCEKNLLDGYISSSKYLKDNPNLKFNREILIEVKDEETMHIMETLCIMKDKCENDFNVNGTLGAWILKYCTYRGKFVTEETRQKLSETSTGRHHTEEAKAKISKAQKGKKERPEVVEKMRERSHEVALKIAASRKAHGYVHSEETRQKISESQKGKEAWNKGIPLTDEQKQKMSVSLKKHHIENEEFWREVHNKQKGFKHTEETKRKMSESQKGKHNEGHVQTEETRQKISEKLKGVKKPKFSEEHRKHISEAHKGLVVSEELREKRRNRKWVTDGVNSKFVKDYETFLKENPDWRLGRA